MNAKDFDWSECTAVWRDPERMGGQWCFNQTRLPVKFLFANLRKGAALDEFCEWYPPVTREQCSEVLAFVEEHSSMAMA